MTADVEGIDAIVLGQLSDLWLNLGQLLELFELNLLSILDCQLIGVFDLADESVLVRAIHFVEFDNTLEVNLLLLDVSLLALLLGEVLIVVMPGLKSILIKFVQLLVGLWIYIYDKVRHSVEDLLIDDRIPRRFAHVALGKFGTRGSRLSACRGLVFCLQCSQFLIQEMNRLAEEATFLRLLLRRFGRRQHLRGRLESLLPAEHLHYICIHYILQILRPHS